MLSKNIGSMQHAAHSCRSARCTWHSSSPVQLVCAARRRTLQPSKPSDEVGKLSATPENGTSSSSSSSNSSNSSNSSSSTIGFHNRTWEVERLNSYLSNNPKFITIIMGPRSTGKTALLQQYMSSRGLSGSQCFVDGRRSMIDTPSALASELLRTGLPKILGPMFPGAQEISGMLVALKAACGAVQDRVIVGGNQFTIQGSAITALLGYLAPGREDIGQPPLAVVTAAYTTLLDVWEQARAAGKLQDTSPPVLGLDEVNVLMQWGEQYKAERQGLLRFFVHITKVSGRSHVLLATSDYAFQTWLSEEIGPGFFQYYVIGDFAAEDARQFLDKHLRQLGQPEVSDDDWGQVHEVCGGNAGDLQLAAEFKQQFSDHGGWPAGGCGVVLVHALEALARTVWITMRRGYMPKADAGYTAADYATAVKAILDSPHHAVAQDQLDAVLGDQATSALVQANLLALRPYSYWAKDIDLAAFGPGKDSVVVTALTPLHLFNMHRHKERLLAALNSQQAQPVIVNGDNRPPSPTSAKLAAVARDITDVTASIQAVERQLSQAIDDFNQVQQNKSEGWQDYLAYLRGYQQQLVEEKKQLREQLRLDKQKELLLMKREDVE